MLKVKVLRRGLEIVGINFSKKNVLSYFPKPVEALDFELDHLRIQCALNPTFWANNPEIHDPRLNVWLAAKCARKPGRNNCRILMSQTDSSSFRLQVAPAKVGRKVHTAA